MQEHEIKIIYKKVKKLRLRVKDNLEVTLTVPLRTSQAAIDAVLSKRRHWVTKHLEYFKQRQVKPKEYINGEIFKFLGHDYTLLTNQDSCCSISIQENNLMLYLTDLSDGADKRSNLVKQWYKDQAMECFVPILHRYCQLINKSVTRLVIRSMKTRWGSCNPMRGYINLNLELITKPLPAIEYVILHELTHLTHYHHNQDFYNYMSLYMPDWKSRKQLLSLP